MLSVATHAQVDTIIQELDTSLANARPKNILPVSCLSFGLQNRRDFVAFFWRKKANATRARTRDTRDEVRRLLPSRVYSPPKFQLFDNAVQFTLTLSL